MSQRYYDQNSILAVTAQATHNDNPLGEDRAAERRAQVIRRLVAKQQKEAESLLSNPLQGNQAHGEDPAVGGRPGFDAQERFRKQVCELLPSVGRQTQLAAVTHPFNNNPSPPTHSNTLYTSPEAALIDMILIQATNKDFGAVYFWVSNKKTLKPAATIYIRASYPHHQND